MQSATAVYPDYDAHRAVLTLLPYNRQNVNLYLDAIWRQYFSDVARMNDVQIAYRQPWKSRLGLIRMTLDNAISFIGVNALLLHQQVPEYLLITTIAHELTHYAHGFGSPLPRLYSNPHANNVVTIELQRRGLGEYAQQSDAWIDKHWFPFYDTERKSGWAGIPATFRPTRRCYQSTRLTASEIQR